MKMLRSVGLVLAASLLLAAGPPAGPMLGFGPLSAARERVNEGLFLDLPSAQGALDHLDMLGTRPHYAGTRADRAMAEYAR
ncbi:MAG: hypothetical protein JO103_09440, partial [Candidatus Eremiobacteraeota bacterium]|nr:hypothetical protein [Candidatus Eremiobacteraeota bacterium]